MQTKRYLKRLYPVLLYILKAYLLALIFLFLLRISFILFNLDQIAGASFNDVVKAMILGLHFDNTVVCAISLIPLLSALLITLFSLQARCVVYVYNIYYIIAFFVILGFSVADIPYFQYFMKHFDISISSWMQYGGSETYSMLYTETSYYKFYLLFLIIITVSGICIVKFGKQWKQSKQKINNLRYLMMVIPIVLLCGLALSRKYGTESLNIKKAYFSEHSFVNELGINTTYYFVRSLGRPTYQEENFSSFISEPDATKLVREYIKAENYIDSISPICHKIVSEKDELNANVIIVLMESMSSYYLTDRPELTPTLNELKNKSYYFSNIYSAGTHTNQGIFSTLFGIPAMFEKNITDNRGVTWNNQINEHLPICEGLPYNLNKKGYTSSFFIAHTKNFDNLGVFFSKNGYSPQNIFSIENYPTEKRVNSWGVNDEYLFEFAIHKFNKQQKPFFGSIMTITNHPPFVIPDSFTHISSDELEQAVYYADNCIKVFLEDAAKQTWFNNTIFVFVGDHGRLLGKSAFDMPLEFNHVPLIIYSPIFTEMPQSIDKFGSQIDIFPTVMGMLNITYENNSLGIDLLKEDRGYSVFSSDGKLGYIDNEYLYSFNTLSETNYLYKYKDEESPDKNIATAIKDTLTDKKRKAAATVIVTNYMLKRRLTSKNKH